MDGIIICVVLLLMGLAAWYVIRAKKKGKTCIGCTGGCAGNCSGCQGCHRQENP